jgi:hypothetical protein
MVLEYAGASMSAEARIIMAHFLPFVPGGGDCAEEIMEY